MGTQSQGVALGWLVPRRWRSNPAAVKTSITWPSVVMALLTSWRMAASICSGFLRLLLLCLLSAACRAWSRADWRDAIQPERSGDSPATSFKSNRGKLPTGSPKGERGGAHQRAGKFCHHLQPALLAVFLFENVFLSGRFYPRPSGETKDGHALLHVISVARGSRHRTTLPFFLPESTTR